MRNTKQWMQVVPIVCLSLGAETAAFAQNAGLQPTPPPSNPFAVDTEDRS